MDDERLLALEREIARIADRVSTVEERLGMRRVERRAPTVREEPPSEEAERIAAEPPPLRREDPAPAPSRLDVDLEDLLGGRVLAWLGGAAVLLGVVFFLVMAVSRGWIDEPTRTVLAFVGSTALLALGVYLYEAKGQTEAALAAVAAALAALYASLTVATQVYELVAPVLGLGIAAVVGAVATAIAVRWNAPGVAALGILGALVSPVLVDAGASLTTLAFMALALCSAVGVLVWRRWDWLAVGAYLVSAPQLVFWLVDEDSLALRLGALGVFWAIYVVAAIGYELRVPTERLRPSSGGLLVANALFIAAAGYFVLDEERHPDGATIWVMGVALTHILLGAASFRGRISREIALVLLAVAVGLSAVAFALALDGPALVAAWSVEAVILTWLAARSGYQRSYLAAAVFLALAIGHALLIDARPDELFEAREDWTGTIGIALVTVAAALIRYLYEGPWPQVRPAVDIVALAGLAYLPPLVFEGVEVVLIWATEAVLAALFARRFDEEHVRATAPVFVGLAAAHALALEAQPDGLRNGVDDLGLAALAVGAVGASALASALLTEAPRELRAGLIAATAVAAVYLPSLAIVDVTTTGDEIEPGQTPQVLLSAFWALTAFGAIVYGLVRDQRTVRLGGLLLLGIAVVKVFLYDLAELESGYRALSFVALGLLMLAGAYAYQRMRTVRR